MIHIYRQIRHCITFISQKYKQNISYQPFKCDTKLWKISMLTEWCSTGGKPHRTAQSVRHWHIHRTLRLYIQIMARSIHITTARTMLNSGDPVDISVWKANGEILHNRLRKRCNNLWFCGFAPTWAILYCEYRHKNRSGARCNYADEVFRRWLSIRKYLPGRRC